jgi:hypothetical protein
MSASLQAVPGQIFRHSRYYHDAAGWHTGQQYNRTNSFVVEQFSSILPEVVKSSSRRRPGSSERSENRDLGLLQNDDNGGLLLPTNAIFGIYTFVLNRTDSQPLSLSQRCE